MKYLFAFVLWLSVAVAWAEDSVPLGDVFTVMFLNRAPSTAVPTNIGGTPAIDVYEEGSATPITTADGTFTVNYGSVTGLAHCELTCSSGNGFEVGKWYNAVISGTTPTSDSVSIAGTPVARFRVMAAEAAAGQPLTTVDGANSTGLLTAANIQTECEEAIAATLADIADAILDEATAGHTTAGTLGKAVIDTLADTNELQTDWANGGRLDLILDTTLKYNVEYFDTTANGDIGRTFNTTDPTVGSDPTPAP